MHATCKKRTTALRQSVWIPALTVFGSLFIFAAPAVRANSSSLPAQIVVLQSADGGPYAEFTQQFRQTLRHSSSGSEVNDVVLTVGTDTSPRLNALATDNLITAVGTEACRAALNSSTRAPILCALIPRITADQLTTAAHPPHRVTTLYLDQPLSRYFALIRLMMPQATRVGTVLGPATSNDLDSLSSVARHEHVTLLHANVKSENENPLPALEHILRDSDVILALPDPAVYNRYTLPPLLLTTFRYRVPVIGFSPAFVNAGALGGLYSTPAQIGQQAAEMIARQHLSAGGKYPRYFEVSFNQAVATALDLSLPDTNRVKALLQKQGDAP